MSWSHGIGPEMAERDTKWIIRQWDREIDDERRRHAPRRVDGAWKFVSWAALWLVWLALLVAVVALIKPLHW